jgi:hypothetical protein
MTPTPSAAPPGGASTADVLTAIKNIVTALGTASQNFLNVNGITNAANISVPTVVKTSAGRIARVSIIVAGSATGFVYDGASLTATTKPLWVIPAAAQPNGEPYEVNFATSFGLLIVPGAGQTVSVGFS